MTETQTTAPEQTGRTGFLRTDWPFHLTFGALLAAALVAFTVWSSGHVAPGTNFALLLTAIVLGLFLAFNMGGNDVANSFGTSVGAGTLTMKQALLVAAIFEVSGAVLAGGAVTDTVRSSIVDLSGVASAPMDFVYIMMASLLGAALWLLIATIAGLPVSTTHAVIGGMVGATVTVGVVTGTGGFSLVQWDQIGQIAVSWVLSPVLGGTVSWLLFSGIKRRILVHRMITGQELRADLDDSPDDEDTIDDEDDTTDDDTSLSDRLVDLQAAAFAQDEYGSLPTPKEPGISREERRERRAQKKAAKKAARHALETWVPVLAGGAAMILAAMLLFKGLAHTGIHLGHTASVVLMIMIGFIAWISVHVLAKSLHGQSLRRTTFILFSWMQVFTASAFAFSHGSNDISNALGPFAGILDVLATGKLNETAPVPLAALVTAGIALVAGLWFVGRRVIHTVGSGLTQMHPASGFAAELSAAVVVLTASAFGLPVSSTHILIGAIMGVGLVNKSANWRLMKPIGLAWVITLPAAAIIGALGVLAIRAVF
jgi:PiT family inorganic phosphate transporter